MDGLVEEVAFFAGVLLVIAGSFGTGALLILISGVLYLYKYFFHARLEMRRSRLAADSIEGRPASRDDARAATRQNKRVYRVIAVLSYVANKLGKAQNKGGKSGIVGLIMRVMVAGILEFRDLVSHYLLPAAVIDGYGISDGVDSMKRLQDNVPETLVGVFGIDVASHAVGAIMGPIHLLILAVGVGLGFLVGDGMSAFYLPQLVEQFGGSAADLPGINIFPLIVAIFITKFASIVVDRVTTSVKVLYFTLFYMRITHNDRIASDMRASLDSYLKMEVDVQTTVAQADFAEVAAAVGEWSKGESRSDHNQILTEVCKAYYHEPQRYLCRARARSAFSEGAGDPDR